MQGKGMVDNCDFVSLLTEIKYFVERSNCQYGQRTVNQLENLASEWQSRLFNLGQELKCAIENIKEEDLKKIMWKIVKVSIIDTYKPKVELIKDITKNVKILLEQGKKKITKYKMDDIVKNIKSKVPELLTIIKEEVPKLPERIYNKGLDLIKDIEQKTKSIYNIPSVL